MNSALAETPVVLGSTTARIFTPPLVTGPPGPCGCGCALDEETSEGFDVVEFAEMIDLPLDPWERWCVIHGMEMLPDGRPRFRQLLVLVARQNGKTHMCVVLSLYWVFLSRVPLVLGTSTKLDYAKISWDRACKLAQKVPFLAADLPATRNRGIRTANGEQTLTTIYDAEYKIAASNGQGGRSLTVHRLIEDELREHTTWLAHNAAENAMNAVDDAQAWGITNQGPDTAVVLESLRASALNYIETGKGDSRLGLFEWSAPDGAEVDDLEALAMANPQLGRRMHVDNLLGKAKRAREAGGEEEMTFKIEVLCQRVRLLNPAINPGNWARSKSAGSMDAVRDRLAMCVDVSPDGMHVTAAVAGVEADGRIRVELVGDWAGPGAVRAAATALPALERRIKPKVRGWFPGGPGAALAADMRMKPRPGTKAEEIKGDVSAVCMSYAALVRSEQVLHSGDPLLDSHTEHAEKLYQGDVWRFSRKGEGNVDAVYAAAGAVQLARTLKTTGKPRLVTSTPAHER